MKNLNKLMVKTLMMKMTEKKNDKQKEINLENSKLNKG